ncbi:hypothetical protein [Klebsiella pneumoniae]|nr:hypothetical protein [Klebsiella pneumoniae]
MGEISVKTGNNARNGGKNSLNRLIRCVCGKKIGPDPRNFNQRVSLGRNDLLIRTFLKRVARMALTAMDGEPVVFTDERNLHHIAMGRETSLIWGKQNSETGDIPLYRHAKLVPDALIQAVAFYEQVKRENPPVETGAYKDAVEWVLREACRAVIKDE